MRQIYMAKAAGLLTLLVFSPLIILGIISIGVVHAFDYIGQAVLWPAHKITDWLQEYQRDQIRSGHAVLPLEEIQARVGIKDDDE
jgi:hypothetical protein